MLKDKFKLTKDQNRRFARSNLVRLVYTNSRFEGLTTTLPQTQTIIDGLGVDGVPLDDINVIVQLKRGWQFVINSDEALSLSFMQHVNEIVALNESLCNFQLNNEQQFLDELLNKQSSITDKAITLMYHLMRNQIFWDGNKRTATLVANKLMIDNGVGLINVPLNEWPTWNEMIADYYFSDDMSAVNPTTD